MVPRALVDRTSPQHRLAEARKRRQRCVRVAFHLAAASLLFVRPVAGQDDPGFWAFLEKGRVVSRCVESSAAYHQAAARLQRLDERIQALADPDPVVEIVGELHGLLQTECFLMAAETDRIPKPDTARSLKEWWIEAGGRHWLASYLELPRLGRFDSPMPHVVVPPDARKTLNLEAHGRHPLSALLCSLSKRTCGAETRGWKLRADAFFKAHRILARDHAETSLEEPPSSDPEVTSRACADKAASADPAQRYQRWRACLEAARPQRIALPLGELEAPTAGWIVIAGRRGHYEFCDTTRAYNLATGTAFTRDSCSGLVLESDGNVDFAATNTGRVERVRVGTIPRENLREAVWMMLFRGEAEEAQQEAKYYPLPAGLVPQLTIPMREEDSSGSGVWAHTGQTVLTWRWIPATGPTLVGELTWPDSSDAAESHAASLLQVAEAGFVDGCAGILTPAMLARRTTRNLNEAPPDAVRELDLDLQTAFKRWKSLEPCRPR